jgi:hypothetical protein
MSLSALGQESIYLRKKSNGRLKKLRSKTYFEVMTTKQGYFGKIYCLTDSTLILREYQKPHWTEEPKYDTLKLTDIKSISNPLLNNDDANTLGGMLIIGAGLGLIATPIVWAAKGDKEGKDALVFTGTLLAIGGVALLPSVIKKKYNLKEWEIVNK